MTQYRLLPEIMQKKNRTCLIWISFYTVIASVFTIIVPILFFIYMGDILILTHMDMINSIALLTGLITLPSALFVVWAAAAGTRINANFRVAVCPLWFSILCILIVNLVGVVHCVRKITTCDKSSLDVFNHAMHKYRTVINYRRFVDNLQWNLRCCGLQSYKDWYSFDWYDKSTETDLTRGKRSNSDCVPFSCCKSGSCISSYLSELGTYFINRKGCGSALTNILAWFIFINLIIFSLNIIAQIATFSSVVSQKEDDSYNRDIPVQMMGVNQNFRRSSTSGDQMYRSRTNTFSKSLNDGSKVRSRSRSKDINASKSRVTINASESRMAGEPSEWQLADPSASAMTVAASEGQLGDPSASRITFAPSEAQFGEPSASRMSQLGAPSASRMTIAPSESQLGEPSASRMTIAPSEAQLGDPSASQMTIAPSEAQLGATSESMSPTESIVYKEPDD